MATKKKQAKEQGLANVGEALEQAAEVNRNPAAEEPKPKKRGKKQKELPGMVGAGVEQVECPDIEDAADAFVEKRDAWQAAHEPMMAAKAQVTALMQAKGLTSYKYDSKEITYKPGEANLKVKKLADHVIELEDRGEGDLEDQS